MITPVRLNSLNNINFTNFFHRHSKSTFKNPNSVFTSAPFDTVEIKANTSKSTDTFLDFIKQKGKVSKADYDKIKENNPEIISTAKSYVSEMLEDNEIYTTPRMAALIAYYADSIISNKNKILSIGTSPSFITECLSAMGKDVTFIPVSMANQCLSLNNMKDYFAYYPNYKKVGDFLKYNGITPQKLKDKDVVILDYYSSGRTLHMMGRLVQEYCNIPFGKIHKNDLEKLIRFIHYQAKKNGEDFDYKQIIYDIDTQKMENMSNVPHFPIAKGLINSKSDDTISAEYKSRRRLFAEFDEFSRPSARAYQLCVLDEMENLKKQKEAKDEN